MSGGVEAEDGGHGAFACGDGLLHVLAAGADGADGVGEGEGSGGDVGGVFAEGVAGGEGGLDAAFGEDAGGGDGDGEDGGLRVLGELELVFGAFEDELGEGEAESFVGLVEDGASDGEVVVEIAAHADGLRTLAGKEEGWFIVLIVDDGKSTERLLFGWEKFERDEWARCRGRSLRPVRRRSGRRSRRGCGG